MMVNAIQGLVYFPVFWYQTIEMIHLGLDRELILFGIANLLTTAGTILGVQILRWIERPVESGPQSAPGATGGRPTGLTGHGGSRWAGGLAGC